MNAVYRTWRFLQDRVVGNIAAITMLVVTVFAVGEFFGRYLIGHTYHWGQDAVTHLMIAATFLYFGASQANRSHLAVTLLPDWLMKRGRIKLALAIRAAASLLVVLFALAFVYWGLPGAERTYRTGRMTESMIIPLWPFQYALIAGLLMMGISALFQAYRDVMRLLGHNAFPWESEHEEFEL